MEDFTDSSPWATVSPTTSPKRSLEVEPVWGIPSGPPLPENAEDEVEAEAEAELEVEKLAAEGEVEGLSDADLGSSEILDEQVDEAEAGLDFSEAQATGTRHLSTSFTEIELQGETNGPSSLPPSPPSSPPPAAPQAATLPVPSLTTTTAEPESEPFDEDFDDDFGDFDVSPSAEFDAHDAGDHTGFGFGAFDVDPEDEGGNGGITVDGDGFTEEPNDIWAEPLKSLILRPFPSPPDLLTRITEVLQPVLDAQRDVGDIDVESLTTDEPVRQVEGLAQLLTTESSRTIYAELTTLPALRPLDWTRSRVRREHLISLGIPVNLDEVEMTRASTLPPLNITTNKSGLVPRPSSATSGSQTARGYPQHAGQHPNRSASAGPGPSSLAQQQQQQGRQRSKNEENELGEKPEFNAEKAKRLLGYREDQLSLVPPKYLARMQEDLVEACSSAASLVAYLRQLKDIRSEDNKRKNDQIAELISKAQRLKTTEVSQSSGGLFRKGSTSIKKNSQSPGSSTPNRVSSPRLYQS